MSPRRSVRWSAGRPSALSSSPKSQEHAMPWICTPDFSAGCAPGVKSGPWFHPAMWDEPVPLTVTRRRLDPGATDRIPLRGRENFGYVIAGSAAALAAPDAEGERFTLGAESVLWLTGCGQMSAHAGQDGLD